MGSALARRPPRLALPRPQVRRAVSLPLRTPLLRLHVARLAIDLDWLSTHLTFTGLTQNLGQLEGSDTM